MMAEYISICRSCFHSYVCERFNEHRDSDNKECLFSNDHYVSTADVVEVEHGEWNIIECNKENGTVLVECECGAVFKLSMFDFGLCYNYCPNCGAKMGVKE